MTIEMLYVFNTDKVLVGRLRVQHSTPEGYKFQYAKSYLNKSDALAINPIHLPLIDKTFFSKKGFNGALLSFNDALPGVWGKAVLKSINGRALTDFELLLQNQQDRLGNLVFSTEKEFPNILEPRNKEPFKWKEIIEAKGQFERDNSFSEKYAKIFKQGSSQGGARPKLTVLKDDELYLAKLPSIRDYENNAQIEHGTLCLAKKVGINAVDSSIISINSHTDVFLTKRFDIFETGKLPYLSMQSILGVEESFEASYGDFALALKRLNRGRDSLEVFKRMVFNALVSNHDDHYQNHAAYFKDGLWQLTPAFDIAAGESNRRTLAISAGTQGDSKHIENIISESDKFNLDQDEALSIFEQMRDYIENNWAIDFNEAGVEANVIDSVKWAILNDY
ncbi:hypothetical protein CYQ88_11410 [Hydrogenovibrio sp. SC-1]|uniref:type II toxin-antitoxin system HipA family toxin n=1 Tax=Hydrogenovibrio sp. SC-1 TaxID=2065820 RepID=UPI000C797EB4|nr:type II toxin-antitoxin system HipA family toxin [Hydrogenovibrio sp. SC-1]PLA73405.1 hypothetical protein CYQ88_11410 [Hydrogenovibrio sp. SC-1]